MRRPRSRASRARSWCSCHEANAATTTLVSAAFTANVLQGFTHRIGSERGQSSVRDRNVILSALLQSHRSCGDLYLESPVAGANLESLAGHEVERLAKRFRDDESPGRANGSVNGKYDGRERA